MVGENFDFLMSEVSKTAVNYQKTDFPPGKNQKIQILHPNHFSPGILKSDSPPGRILWKILISPQNFRERWHYVIQLRVKLTYKKATFMVTWIPLNKISVHGGRWRSFVIFKKIYFIPLTSVVILIWTFSTLHFFNFC